MSIFHQLESIAGHESAGKKDGYMVRRTAKFAAIPILIYCVYYGHFLYSADLVAAALMREIEPDLARALQGQILTQSRDEAKQPQDSMQRPSADFIWEHATSVDTGVLVYVTSRINEGKAETSINIFRDTRSSDYSYVASVLYALHRRIFDYLAASEGPTETRIQAGYVRGDSGPSYNYDVRTSAWRSSRSEIDTILSTTDSAPDWHETEDVLKIKFRRDMGEAAENGASHAATPSN